MRKTILAASLVLPLLVLACNRNEPAPTAAMPSPEKQAATSPTSPDKMLERSPPAAGTPSDSAPTAPADTQSSTPASPPAAAGAMDKPPSEPPKSGY